MKYRSIFRIGLLASTILASTSLLAMAGEVTTPRLLNAGNEPQNWLMVNKDYAAHRYSELDQINKNSAKDPGTNKADFMVASNRGVTLYKNFVISVTADCKVLWTKADTGELVRTVQFDGSQGRLHGGAGGVEGLGKVPLAAIRARPSSMTAPCT